LKGRIEERKLEKGVKKKKTAGGSPPEKNKGNARFGHHDGLIRRESPEKESLLGQTACFKAKVSRGDNSVGDLG